MTADKLSPYVPASEYTYPWPYNISHDIRLATSTIHTQNISNIGAEIDPREALIEWSLSSPGSWQAKQTARYPNFHRDLPDSLIPTDHLDRPDEFRRSMLRLMTADMSSETATSSIPEHDFHALGHMARVLTMVNTLFLDTPFPSDSLSAELITAIRHGAALHDIAEIEHPGAIINHGNVLGDVSAAVGKTASDRALEKAIFLDVLPQVFLDTYTPEIIEIMTLLVSHEVPKDDTLMTRAHGVLEFAHHLNAVETGIAMGDKAADLPPTLTSYANPMTALAEQSSKILRRKFEAIFQHSPELKRSLGNIAVTSLASLERVAHCRDENPEWLAWRQSEAATIHFGEYSPATL